MQRLLALAILFTAIGCTPRHEENEDVERGYAEEHSDTRVDDVERSVSAPPDERWPERSGGGPESSG